MPRPSVARKRNRVLVLALGVASLSVGIALLPLEAAGDAPKLSAAQPASVRKPKGPLDGGEKHDPDNITSLSPFMELIGRGNEKYAAKEYAAAIDIYKQAIQLNPRNPLGPYVLGEAHLAMNNLAEAEAAFKAAEQINDAKTPPLVRSHVLFAVADVYEREKKWEQSRAAWQIYTEHAAKLGPDGGAHPLTGVARLKALDDWLKLEKQSELVRQRIAAEKSDAAPPAPAKK
jgi:tetratricopeptide (TPR) repeat protein